MKKKKGLKFDSGKPPMELISYYAMEELAKTLEFGRLKYSAWNWSDGILYSRVISAAERHIGKWKSREDLDDETGLSHLAHAMCNIMFLLDYEARGLKQFDDRRPIGSVKRKKNEKYKSKSKKN